MSLIKEAEVLPYQQSDNSNCSSACLKVVLSHYGHEYTEKDLSKLIGVRTGIGAETTQIVEAAEKLGFNAFEGSFNSLEDAKKLLDKDIPLIADFQSWNYEDREHYVVLTKIDNTHVYLMDPNTPGNQRKITHEEADARWWGQCSNKKKFPHLPAVMEKWAVVVTNSKTKIGGSTESGTKTKVMKYKIHTRVPFSDSLDYLTAHKVVNGQNHLVHALLPKEQQELNIKSVAAYAATKIENNIAALEVTALYVDPKYRGAGLTKHLVDIIRYCHPIDDVYVTPDAFKDKEQSTEKLKKFYSHLGFVPTNKKSNLLKLSPPFKEKTASSAVIITGNPKFIKDNPLADKYYLKLRNLLESKGYTVSTDPGEPHTSPPKADVWIGHSRGVDRLRFAPKDTITIPTGAGPGTIHHPKDLSSKMGDIPNNYHYVLNSEMKKAILSKLKIKTAEITTQLQPHQQRVLNKITRKDQPGLVVAHGLGSGKTLSAIAAQESLGLDADVVVPAALQENYAKEVRKHTSGKSPKKDIQSMQNVAIKKKQLNKKMLIVDEAHRVRDPGSTTLKTLKNSTAEKRLLLTASPFYNHPHDIAPLVNLASGETTLPNEKAEFEKKYVGTRRQGPGFWGYLKGKRSIQVPSVNQKNKKELSGILNKWVDYHPSSSDEYPSVEREDVKVPITSKQREMYDTVMGQAPAWVAHKIRNNLPPTKAESKQLNAYLSAVRQIVNSTAPFQKEGNPEQPKIDMAFNDLKSHLKMDPRNKGVVYSNFLSSGIAPYKKKLDEAKIPYGEFSGEMPKLQRDELVKQYNQDKLRALIISSAGGEGLDLKGTRLMQILEPHWNEEKINQVEGRGIRFRSHAHLPEKDRKVLIKRYLASMPRVGVAEKLRMKDPGTSVDEYLANRSEEKSKLIQEFRNLLNKNKN